MWSLICRVQVSSYYFIYRAFPKKWVISLFFFNGSKCISFHLGCESVTLTSNLNFPAVENVEVKQFADLNWCKTAIPTVKVPQPFPWCNLVNCRSIHPCSRWKFWTHGTPQSLSSSTSLSSSLNHPISLPLLYPALTLDILVFMNIFYTSHNELLRTILKTPDKGLQTKMKLF
jgi:hypothetical protein